MLEYSIHLVHMPLPRSHHLSCHSSQCLNMHKDDNHYNCRGFLEEHQLRWTCTTGNKWCLCSFILSQKALKQLASSMVTGHPPLRVRVPSASNIKLGGGQRMRLYILISVYAFSNIIDDGQKLTKSMPRKRSTWGIYTRENTLLKNFAVKEGEGRLLKGGVFSETYGLLLHQFW